MNQIKLISLALMVGLTNAYADGDVAAPEYWSGTYFGAHFGAGAGTVNQSFSDQSILVQKSAPNSVSSTTTLGAGQRQGNITGSNLDLFVGYNVHRDQSKYIIGGQLEGTLFNSTTMKASGVRYYTSESVGQSGGTIYSSALLNGTAVSEMSTDLQSMFSFIGRVGFLPKPNTMLYALIGGTEGDFRLVESSGGAVGAAGTASGNKLSQWQLGLTAGGGVEYKFSEHWSLLGEYRYLHFSFNQNGSLSSASNTLNQLTQAPQSTSEASSGQKTRSNFNFNLGQIGIVYRI